MNLKDFSEHVFRQWERHERDAEDIRVVIEVREPSLGCRATVPAGRSSVGIDWEKNMFIIQPEKPLLRKSFVEENMAEKASELRTAVEKWVRHAAKHPEKDGISRAADEIMSAAQEYMSRCIGAGERR